ncbi:MAG TPA: FHA domain-containing protein, partial [Ktedonobacterales bacterium]|nr:FHA domain-containing protein [Ktedonobacterales bacterium]
MCTAVSATQRCVAETAIEAASARGGTSVAGDLALVLEGNPQYRQLLPNGKWTLVRIRPGERAGKPGEIGVADARVSRQHATIIVWRDRASILDLHSTDGTFVNGRRIEGRTPL